jgi:hypothetical protein
MPFVLLRTVSRHLGRPAAVAALAAALTASQGALPSAAGAQGSAAARGAAHSASASTVVAPSRQASVAGVRLHDARGLQVTAGAPNLPALAAAGNGRGQTLAIVGGAAFLGGLLIGDDVGTAIAVGGLFVGVYGLWLWLK